MSDRDVYHPDHHAEEADRLIGVGEAYQDAIWEWRVTRDAVRREQLLLDQALALEQLYVALKADLAKLINGWNRSQQFKEVRTTRSYREAVDTIALSLVGAIAAELPKLRLDPNQNVRGLLLTIARRDLYNQEYKIYTSGPPSRADSKALLASGDHDAAMWMSPHERNSGVWQSEGDTNVFVEPEDPTSTDFEGRLITRDLALRCWPIIKQLWRQALSVEDWNIITMRWSTEPPVPFADIARQLGAGWTMDAVKMRHHRILKRTREYLMKQKLLNAEE